MLTKNSKHLDYTLLHCPTYFQGQPLAKVNGRKTTSLSGLHTVVELQNIRTYFISHQCRSFLPNII